MYSMSICLLPICLFIVMSYVTLLSMEEIKNTYLLIMLIMPSHMDKLKTKISGGNMGPRKLTNHLITC